MKLIICFGSLPRRRYRDGLDGSVEKVTTGASAGLGQDEIILILFFLALLPLATCLLGSIEHCQNSLKSLLPLITVSRTFGLEVHAFPLRRRVVEYEA
jgi:hypothetical protein